MGTFLFVQNSLTQNAHIEQWSDWKQILRWKCLSERSRDLETPKWPRCFMHFMISGVFTYIYVERVIASHDRNVGLDVTLALNNSINVNWFIESISSYYASYQKNEVIYVYENDTYFFRYLKCNIKIEVGIIT